MQHSTLDSTIWCLQSLCTACPINTKLGYEVSASLRNRHANTLIIKTHRCWSPCESDKESRCMSRQVHVGGTRVQITYVEVSFAWPDLP